MTAIFDTVWTCQSLGEEPFDCPHCGEERDAARAVSRPYLALFGRPLLSLRGEAEYWTCQHCGRTYDRRHLEPGAAAGPDPGSEFPVRGVAGELVTASEDDRAIWYVVAAAVFSDSSIRSAEKRVARNVIRRYTGELLDEQGVNGLLRIARRQWGDPVANLERLGCVLSRAAKARIVAATYEVCTADREVHPEESRLLMRIADALGVGPREVRDFIRAARHR
jgi:uncharacterized tellurite resistance protein B-like protein